MVSPVADDPDCHSREGESTFFNLGPGTGVTKEEAGVTKDEAGVTKEEAGVTHLC